MAELKSDALQAVLKRLSAKEAVSEGDYRRLFALVAAAADATACEDASRAVSFDDIYRSVSYEGLSEFVEDAFFDRAGDVASFDEGACWAFVGIVRAAVKRAERQARVPEVARAARRQVPLLHAIRKNPGITQNELADAVGKGKSNLSQILTRLEARGLIVVRSRGRFRHYYISALGEAVLKEVGRQMRAASRLDNAGQSEWQAQLGRNVIGRHAQFGYEGSADGSLRENGGMQNRISRNEFNKLMLKAYDHAESNDVGIMARWELEDEAVMLMRKNGNTTSFVPMQVDESKFDAIRSGIAWGNDYENRSLIA